MKNLSKVITAIENNKELIKKINSQNYYSIESFIKDAQRYIKAIEERRMICNILSVSSSGMSRTIKFLSCEKNKNNKEFYFSNYNQFFNVLGYTKSRSNDFAFTISGCGMDMIFHTNYTNIHRLGKLGLLNKKQVDKLAQYTPTIA